MSNYISPFISSTELLARLRYRDTHGALRLIRRTWGHMLTAGPGTLWEKVAFDGLPANYVPLQKPGGPLQRRQPRRGLGVARPRLGRRPGARALRLRPRHPPHGTWLPPLDRRPRSPATCASPRAALPPRTAPSRPAGRAGRAAAPSSSRSPRPAARAGSSTCPCSAGAARSRWTAGSCGTAGVIAAGPAPGRRRRRPVQRPARPAHLRVGGGRSMTRRGVRPSLVLLAGVGGTWAATGASPAVAGPRARERA